VHAVSTSRTRRDLALQLLTSIDIARV